MALPNLLLPIIVRIDSKTSSASFLFNPTLVATAIKSVFDGSVVTLLSGLNSNAPRPVEPTKARRSSTLIVHLHSVSSLSFIYFRRAKVAKRPAETKSVVCSFCSRVALQHPSVVTNLPLQSFLLFVGCCGSHCVRQFLRNIIAVLRLDVPHTMAAKQQGFPL